IPLIVELEGLPTGCSNRDLFVLIIKVCFVTALRFDPYTFFASGVVQKDFMLAACADHLLVFIGSAVRGRLVSAVIEPAEDNWEPHITLDKGDEHFVAHFWDEKGAVAVTRVELARPTLKLRLVIKPGKFDLDVPFLTIVFNGSYNPFDNAEKT